MQSNLWFWLLGVLAVVAGKLHAPAVQHMMLIEQTSEMLCTHRMKLVYVYFVNDTSISHTEATLKHLCDCGISFITLRNNRKRSILEDIEDDGILIFLLMIIPDREQKIELPVAMKRSAAKYVSYIFLLVENSTSIDMAWLRNTFKFFWRIWCLNVVIMFLHENELQIYRYNPFGDNHFLVKRVEAAGKYPTLDEIYPRSLPNMHKNPLRMCIYPDEMRAIFAEDGSVLGSDGLMSAYIAERLNATRIIVHPEDYDPHNRNTDLCFDEVYNDVVDISMNIRFLAVMNFHKKAEYTYVYRRDDLCVLVPKASVTTNFWNLLRAFHKYVWLGILGSIALSYVFCLLVYRVVWRAEAMLLQLVSGILGMPLTSIPQSNALRSFIFTWLFYGILISSAFKANLMSNLMFSSYLTDINTIEQLANSPYDILLFARHMKYLEQFLNISEFGSKLRAKLIIVPDETLIETVQSNNLSYGYLEKNHVAAFQSNELQHHRYGRPLYHLMNDCLVPFHGVFVVPYGSPYLGYVNFLVRSAQEFGFTVYWESLMNAAFMKSGKSVIRDQDGNGDHFAALSLNHFHAAFCLLLVGFIFSGLVFLAELLRKHIKQRRY